MYSVWAERGCHKARPDLAERWVSVVSRALILALQLWQKALRREMASWSLASWRCSSLITAA